MGDLGAIEATDDVLSALNDPAVDVRFAAAHALGDLKGPGAADALIDALATEGFFLNRIAIIESVGELPAQDQDQDRALDAWRELDLSPLLSHVVDTELDVRGRPIGPVGGPR